MITVADILALPSFENVESVSASDEAGTREVKNSTTSLEDLMRFSCQNIVYYLTGEKDKVFKLVN